MKMSYFDDVYIELSEVESVETKNLYENTLLDYATKGHVIAITVEHANSPNNVSKLILNGIAA